MNRHSFLSLLGLAPVAACSAALPAIALSKPENVKDIIDGEAASGLVLPQPIGGYPYTVRDGVLYPSNVGKIEFDTLRNSDGRIVIESMDGGDAVLRLDV